MLEAIAQAAELNDLPRSFHVVDLLQMLCLSGKSGALELIAGGEAGVVFLREGALRHAVFAESVGLDAICAMVARGPATFSFDPSAGVGQETIDLDWENALVEAVLRKRAMREAAETAGAKIPAASLPNERDFSGRQFAGYRIGRKLGESLSDVIYTAEQTSIGRPVVLHILRASLREIPERRQAFLDFASVNANIQHPAILPVYEAGEKNGVDFFAREFVVGRTLEEIRDRGLTISALVALRIIRAVADAFAHLDDHEILHAPLDLSRIFITPSDDVQLAEIAVAQPAHAQRGPAQIEIRKLGRLLIPLTKAAAVPGAGRVLKIIHQMQTAGEEAITQWSALAQETKTLEAILAPPPVFSPRKTGLMDKVKFWGKPG